MKSKNEQVLPEDNAPNKTGDHVTGFDPILGKRKKMKPRLTEHCVGHLRRALLFRG
jgi:hypothetical protein